MNTTILNIIIIIHFLFVLFVVLTPFIGNNYFLFLHSIIIPFVMLHWYTNDNNCALTLMERKIRTNLYGIEPLSDDCITYNLIAPIYDFKKNNQDMSTIIYTITIILWLISVGKLIHNYRSGKLSKLEDLLKY